MSSNNASAYLASVEELNRHSMQQSLRALASVLEPQPELEFSGAETPLLSAMGTVARAQGITLHPPAAEILNQVQDPIQAIARTSQIQVRRVKLAENWWQNASEPMLAFCRADQQPVALLPTAQGYLAFNPINRTHTPVTRAQASELLNSAYVFYRPLASALPHGLGFFRFGIQGHESELLKVLGLGAIGTLLGMVAPQLTAVLVNDVIPNSDRALLGQLGLLLFVVAIAQLIFQISQSILTLRVQTNTGNTLQLAVWDRLLRLSPTFFRQYSSGDLVKRVLSVRQMHQQLSGATQRTLLSGLFALLNLGLMIVYSRSLAWIGIGLGALTAMFTLLSNLCALKQSRLQQQLSNTIQGLIVQLINGIPKLRVAMAEERAFAAWAKQYHQDLRLKLSLRQVSDRVSTFNEILPLVSALLLFGMAVPQLQSTQLTLGTFLAFNFAFVTFIKGVADLSNTTTDLLDLIPAWEQVKTILQAKPESSHTKIHPGYLTGHVALDNVSFGYSEQGVSVLKGITIHAKPGEFVAIVGPSGSGKSTILRLLIGFETPTSGTVTYDGKDLADLDLQAVRRMLGVVLQNGRISTGSIFENIAAGALISLDEAWEAAKMAGIADDIEQMPMKMHTIISEGGSNLSGGQQQRLLIARALVAKPKIILMDEATSALDNQTQAIVADNLEKLNATRIVIAHRLSTIRHADRIYVINAGQVEQVGTFAELMQQEGLFARLAARQIE